MANTIILKGDPQRKEGVAAGTITPGHLLERNSDGEFVVHATAAGNAVPRFAIEQSFIGLTTTDDYSADDQVQYVVCRPGDEVLARVAASATAITTGDYLESAGDGTLRKLTTAAATDEGERHGVIAQALEDVDNSAGGSEVTIKVEVI